MPLKVSFFYNQYNSGWSETYYVPGSDAPKTFADTLTNVFQKNSCSFRSVATFLKAIRVTRIGGTRFSVLVRPYPAVQGTRGSTSSGPDVASTDAVIALTGTGGAVRRLFLRGFADEDVFRDAYGNDTISETISKGVELFVKGMKSYGFAIRFQQRPDNAGLVWQKVSKVLPWAGEPTYAEIQTHPNLPLHAVGEDLTFGGIPTDKLPRFPRTAEVLGTLLVDGETSYKVAYAIPGGVSVTPKNMRLTKLLYAYDNINDWDFERYSEHKTGRPFGSLRGRARATGVRR